MKFLCQLSGGLDSAASTLETALSSSEWRSFGTLFFDLGQPYLQQEREAADRFAQWLKKEFPYYLGHTEISTQLILNEHDSQHPPEYIPVRNLVLGALSANVAYARGYQVIVTGSKTTVVRDGEAYSFPDCSIEFYYSLAKTAMLASGGVPLRIDSPLARNERLRTKAAVIEFVNHCYPVEQLWSCYRTERHDDGRFHYCGTCYHCMEIKETGFGHLFGI